MPHMTTYPGARWWKFDFHTHTPASICDYGKGQNQEALRRITPEEWLLDYMRAGIDCVAVTDHNSGEWIDRLKAALSKLETEKPSGFRPLYLFPGVEITANGGVHVLAIFDPGKTTQDITQLLGAVQYQGKHGESARATDYSVIQVVEQIDRAGAIPILAHVDAANGAFIVLNGNTLGPVLESSKLFAIEVCDSSASKPDLYTQKKLSWAEVLGSDSHHRAGNASQRFPGSHFTWVKMGNPSVEGLKLALLDPLLDGAPLSVRRSDRYPDAQNKVPELWIEKIEVQNARFMGRGQALTASLNPWLNAVVGGRGTGKSSLVEFVRLVLRRERELPVKLSADFTDFARTPKSRDDKGALTADTVLRLTYRKGAARFRIRWTPGGTDPQIEEEQADGSYRAVPGDIRQRFPVRIFSQKQVFAMADELQALLRIVDEAPEVAKANWQQAWNEELSRFLSLRAKRRELQVRLKERPAVEGELADLTRKLSVFEGAAHAKTLKDFQRRQRQKRGIDETAEELARIQQQLSALSAGLAITNIDRSLFDATDPADTGMLALLDDASRKAGEFAGAVAKVADGAKGFRDTWIDRVSRSDWKKKADQAKSDYATLVAQLRGQGVTDPAQYGALVQQRQVLEQKFKSLDELKTQIENLDRQAHGSLKRLDEQRISLTERRSVFLRQSLSNNPHVCIEVQPFGRDLREAERGFRQTIEREDGLGPDILSEDEQSGLIADLYRDLPKDAVQAAEKIKTRVNALKVKLSDVANGKDDPSIGKVFIKHLRQLKPETLDRFQTWSPEDGLAVSYRTGSGQNDFRPIEQGSPGQKTAAVLAFLLSHGTEPMLLDQPEDDLDNHLVYDLIVAQLRENKQRRQLLVVTHNPNIVVNGDAELVLPMDYRRGQCVFVTPPGPGSLQSRAVREEVCRVMEGGRTAFEQRYRRIMLEGPHV